MKCFYCDFAAFSGQKNQVERYLAALGAEASLLPTYTPETLYVGGGTPSELTANQIRDLYSTLRRSYQGAQFVESTFEGNPESLDGEKLEVLAEVGVTRLSLGLQTADDELLKSIGRRHSVADFAEVFKHARGLRRYAISVDLMFGLPGQTLDHLNRTLDFVLGLNPEHISLYGLQVEDRTQFSKRGVKEDSDLGRAMFELSIRELSRAGLQHYEISNYALPGHRSVHNINYWRRGEYLGLGCSAASFLKGVRSSNDIKLGSYLQTVESGRRPIAEIETPVGMEALGEEAFLGLRLIDGFIPSDALRQAFEGPWAILKARGLACEAGPRWRLTVDGVYLANDVFKEFVPPFQCQEAIA